MAAVIDAVSGSTGHGRERMGNTDVSIESRSALPARPRGL